MKYLCFIFLMLFQLVGAETTVQRGKVTGISELNIAPFRLESSSFVNFEMHLMDSGVMCCIEDFARPGKSVFNNLNIDFSITNVQTLEYVLEKLHHENPSIEWDCEGGILVFKASGLAKVAYNPLDLKLQSFKFKGNFEQLLSCISSKLPYLLPLRGQIKWPDYDSRIYELDFPSEVTLRSVLIKLAHDYGITWTVYIFDPPLRSKPNSQVYWMFSRPHPLTWHYKSIISDSPKLHL